MPPSRPSKPRRTRPKKDDPLSKIQPDWLSDPAFQPPSKSKPAPSRFLKPRTTKESLEPNSAEEKPVPARKSPSRNRSNPKNVRRKATPKKRKVTKPRPVWFPWLLWSMALVLLIALASGMMLDLLFSWRSNLIFVTHRHSNAPLEVKLDSKTWLVATELNASQTAKALKTIHQAEGVRISQLKVRRNSTQAGASLARFLSSSELLVFQFRPEYFEMLPVFRGGFVPSTAKDFVAGDGLTFALNANFFDPSGFPLGQVVQHGKELNPVFPTWSGYFFVKGGKTMIGPKSLLEEVPGELEHAIQVYPSVMKNHQVFSYVDQTPDRFFDGKKITYRSLGGVKKDGTLIFLLSGRGGVCNVSELSAIARALEIQHATLFDAGRALQYYFKQGSKVVAFHSFNNRITMESLFGGKLNAVRSPVYLGVRPRKTPSLASHRTVNP